MSKKDFERRLRHMPMHVRELYNEYKHIFSEDLISLWWFPGWTHIVESLLRKLERDEKVEIVRIKSHYSYLYIHYYSSNDKYKRLLQSVNYCCSISCRLCGTLIKLGDHYCEQCR